MQGTPYFQLFLYETVRNTVGGAIFVNKLNSGGMTVLSDCTFYNNFGLEGGSIKVDNGGIIYAVNNRFSNDVSFLETSDRMDEILEDKFEEEKNYYMKQIIKEKLQEKLDGES